MIMTKAEYIAEQQARERRALRDGYSWEEILEAYRLNHEGRRVSYIDKYALEDARENLKGRRPPVSEKK